MNEILSTIIYTIVFIIPGFIVTCIINRVIPKRDKEYNMELLNFFLYSSINALIWSIPVYKFINNNPNFEEHYIMLWLILILIMFVSPIGIYLIIIYFNNINLLKKICKRLDIKFIEVEPSAWDFKFSNMESEWVIVTLKNDKIVAGFMGSLSCASSTNMERYEYDSNNNEWEKVYNTNGILIKQDEIKYIEFFKRERSNNEK